MRRVHRRFGCCARTGADGRLIAAHRLYQPCYPRFRDALDPARLGSWQHCPGHQTSSKQPLGHEFGVFSDHKALKSIGKVGGHNARVQRWLEFLTAFDYTLEYRNGNANGNDDLLSPLPEPAAEHNRR